jgi:hypothetical protein
VLVVARRRPGSIELQLGGLTDAELGRAFLIAGQLAAGRLSGTPPAVERLFLDMARSIDAAMILREDRWREQWSELVWIELDLLDSDGGTG